jgi:L-iditol 2-dehydrogenase
MGTLFMKALRKLSTGSGNTSLVDLIEPEAGTGQVLINVNMAGICGTDLHIFHGQFAKVRPPVTLGHEFAGQVVAVGPGVEGWQAGDRVAVESEAYSCGCCDSCLNGQTNLCAERLAYGYSVDGGFASLVVVRQSALHRLPDGVSFGEGALCEPLAVAVNAVTEVAQVEAGNIVLITGAGPIGQLVMQVAKSVGAKVIITGVDGDQSRLNLAERSGADYCVQSDNDNLIERVVSITSGKGTSVAFECAGSSAALNDCLSCAGRSTQVVQLGLFGNPPCIDINQLALKEIRLSGAFGHNRGTWDKAIDMLAAGKIDLRSLVTEEMPLSQWKQAFDRSEGGLGLKYLLYPED